jgi:hypothetical protein
VRKIIATGILGCALLGAGLADARTMAKFSFYDVAYPDGTVGTMRAGTKNVNSGSVTVCNYYTATDDYLGMYQQAGFTTTDAVVMEDFCHSHYFDRV